MPKPQKPGRDASDDGIDEMPELTAAELKIESLKARIADLSGVALAHVYSTINGKKKKWGKLDAEQVLVNPDIIAEQFGGGEYTVEFMIEGDFVKGGRYVEYNFDGGQYGPHKSPATDNSGLGLGTTALIEILKEQKNDLVRVMEKLIDSRGPTMSADAQLQSVFSLMDRVNKNNPASVTESEEKKILREILSTGLSTLRGDKKPDPEKRSAMEDVFVSIASHLGPVAAQILAKTSGVKMHRPGPAETSLVPGNGSEPEGGDMTFMEKMLGKAITPKIIDIAKKNITVDEGVKAVWAEIPPDKGADDLVYSIVSKDDVTGYLAQFDPGILPYKTWVDEVAAKMKAGMVAVDDKEPAAA